MNLYRQSSQNIRFFTMRAVSVFILLCITCVYCKLWPKGIVHYNMNSKDYDLHSQDVIMKTFGRIEREICVKFFNTPLNYSASAENKILYISNPQKFKDCPTRDYDYNNSVVDMVIGYKCLNNKDIARIVVGMLKASVAPPDPAKKFDLVKKYHTMVGQKQDAAEDNLLSSDDRNLINAYYHIECTNLNKPGAPPLSARRSEGDNSNKNSMSAENWKFYGKLLWPLGVVMYSVEPSLRDTPEYMMLRYAMTHIELLTCIVFVDDFNKDILVPQNLLWFDKQGFEEPALGMVKGNQSIDLYKMVHGWPGHSAHVLNNLMRALGVPMMSNRYDRDNYVFVNWALVEKGKEYLLERMPEEAWIESIPYSFDSVTHAPANYLCANCHTGAQTVQPQQDHLWQRTLAMGHTERLSDSDVYVTGLLYGSECTKRYKPVPVMKPE